MNKKANQRRLIVLEKLINRRNYLMQKFLCLPPLDIGIRQPDREIQRLDREIASIRKNMSAA